jgi:predicted GTPase
MDRIQESIELYEASVLQDIEDALHDSDADRVVDNNDVRRQF